MWNNHNEQITRDYNILKIPNIKKNWIGILEMKTIYVKTEYSYWDSGWVKEQIRQA